MNTAQMGKYLLETRSFQGPTCKLKDTAMYVKKKKNVNLATDCYIGGHHTIIFFLIILF